MRNGGLFVALLFLLQLPGLSQAPLSDWQNLSKIPAGTIVDVGYLGCCRETTGKFVKFSDKDVTLRAERKEITIRKAEILFVALKGSMAATLVGTAAGAAAGGALMPDQETGNHATGAVVGGVIGAVIGGALTPGTVIYKRETPSLRRKQNTNPQPAPALEAKPSQTP